MRNARWAVALLFALSACGGGQVAIQMTTDATDSSTPPDLPPTTDSIEVDVAPDIHLDSGLDLRTDVELTTEEIVPECQPGDGCFLDPCTDNDQCLSGFCLEHLGEGACTVSCIEECPPGWQCQELNTGSPDLFFACISDFPNLCKPCHSGEGCTSPAGADDLCVDYGEEGSFCGGQCAPEDEGGPLCPAGFVCAESTTIDGLTANQCVPEAGTCSCTQKSIDLLLWTGCEMANEFGTCSGKRVCTAEGLSPCDATTPEAEICNGIDDDCDGDIDEPDAVGGDLINLCDDGNDCSEDICTGEEGCTNEPLDGTECADGDPCTVADHCVAGACQGTPAICDDNDPCTDDSCGIDGGCIFEDNAADCDDGNPCTVADECSSGKCKGVAVNCDCEQNGDCAILEDGDKCNGTLFCDTDSLPYQCAVIAESVVECPAPEGLDAPCLASSCDAATGDCSLVPANNGFACDDANACTVGDLCDAGICTAGVAANCNDGNLCTDESCDPIDGCQYSNNEVACQDGSVCTISDLCLGGECTAGIPKDCDDGNVCTDDLCDPVVGCNYAANDAVCDDGNACTIDDHCVNTVCVGSGSLECDDDNPCTKDICLLDGGCAHENIQGGCSDGDACTLDDSCENGVCVGGPAMVCDDGNPCTADACKQGKCLSAPQDAPCDDGNACTDQDSCVEGQCQSAGPLDCDDDNGCTTDYCTPLEGCKYLNNASPCDDGDQCTLVDQCQNGSCQGTIPPDCDDDNPCTGDSCDAELGCQHISLDVPCDDGDACTLGDWCVEGKCEAGQDSLDCDDANLCTDDSCVADTGCHHLPNALDCDDGSACTVGDACQAGICVSGGGTPDCDDNVLCTTDSCAADLGCIHTLVQPCCGNSIVEPPEECDDGNYDNSDDCTAVCQMPTCDDGLANGNETDLDCGGPCGPCEDGSGCVEDADCVSLVCTEEECQVPTCDDEVHNGSETGLDCGGGCPGCADGTACLEDLDCQSEVCEGEICQVPACDDGVENGNETGLDCGGGCDGCADGTACVEHTDCESLNCVDGICQPPQCEDLIKNGDETDVDCGGGECDLCGEGKGCLVDTDCLLAGICVDGICSLWGSGKDGPLAVGSGTTTINTHRTRVNGTTGETTLTALDGTSGLVAGTTIIVHQATGNGAGTWETRRIASVDGSTITLTRSLAATYTTSGSTVAQAVRVHEYTTATLTGGTLTAPDWDGSTGGILAIHASEAVVLQGGTLQLSGKGFRGQGHGCFYRCTDGKSGESPSGPMGTGTSPARNGMAGGGGQRGQDCAAGGGGGYGAAGAPGANGSGGSCAPAGHKGGQGGNAGGNADTSTLILFGGAGGEGGGDEDGGNPGKGGDSGGILILKAPTITVTGANVQLNGSGGANGNQGSCGGHGCGMSGGGGGAGGGAYLVAEDVALGSGKITSTGGGGGACTCGGSYNGGTGAVGRIAVRAQNIAGTTSPAHHALDFP
jgi:hypothetical protein